MIFHTGQNQIQQCFSYKSKTRVLSFPFFYDIYHIYKFAFVDMLSIHLCHPDLRYYVLKILNHEKTFDFRSRNGRNDYG